MSVYQSIGDSFRKDRDQYSRRDDGKWFSRRVSTVNGSYSPWRPVGDETEHDLTVAINPDAEPERIILSGRVLVRQKGIVVRLPR